eukprot:TRINITY_DN14335_c0_g1_i1.p1 TRINITY_DN14335_c0_g1~~TRINITY_DN14335_c0_g1_i1.p1  ORF type:complete len:395 (-),score=85.55 TRINITY_DN14335_c0_g1_i1:355-1539(-)
MEFGFDDAFNDDRLPTRTSIEQILTEKKIRRCFLKFEHENEESLELFRDEHIAYLLRGVEKLGSGLESLDASRPWLCYWILHALQLLNALPEEEADRFVDLIVHFQDNVGGGFCGGPMQEAHLAATYAAVHALVTIGTERAFSIINREKMYAFLTAMKQPNGGFTMHRGGEIDVRASYCALSVASVLGILTPELSAGAAEFLASCQTYEGGIGGEPGNEAHGGYTFCALAALVILDSTHLIDVDRLLHWAVQRQMLFEGGFQGRTNKLVDACYSFWQAGVFPLIDSIIRRRRSAVSANDGDWLFNQRALQTYIVMCCEENEGGLLDKPGKSRDFDHTCYALSGLSRCQHGADGQPQFVLGHPQNLLGPTDPVATVYPHKLEKARDYFRLRGSLS